MITKIIIGIGAVILGGGLVITNVAKSPPAANIGLTATILGFVVLVVGVVCMMV